MRWRDIKISKKITLGFMIPVILMVGIGFGTFQVSQRVFENVKKAKDESIVFALHAQQMEKDVIQVQQWLTDISATRAQNGLNDGFSKAEEHYQSFLSEMEHFREKYEHNRNNEAIQKLNEIENRFRNYYDAGKKMARAYVDGGPELGNKMMNDFDRKAEALQSVLQPFIKEQIDEAEVMMDGIVRVVDSLKHGVAGITAFAIVFIIVVSTFLKRSISAPLKELVGIAKSFGNGDFRIRLDNSRKDEFGEVALHFNQAAYKISKTVQQVKEASHDLASSSEELSASAVQIAHGTEQQTEKAAQVATASQEMSSTIVEVAKNVSGAAEAAGEANKVASKGGGIVEKTIESIKSIADTTKGTSQVITALGERSKDVGKIINVINEIASQTNLLALNAAIEAARAGEQGRGFAVVADEVRKLAEKTTGATKEIEEMIKMIQEDTEKALLSMENEVKVVEEGVKLTMDADAALKEIVEHVEKVSFMIQQIATAADEQSTAADQISGDVEAVASITKEALLGAQQIAEASEEIAKLASDLRLTVETFNIYDTDVVVEKEALSAEDTQRSTATAQLE